MQRRLGLGQQSRSPHNPETGRNGTIAFTLLAGESSASGNIVIIPRADSLLTPEEVGTFAIAAVFAAVAAAMRNFGMSEFLIQERALEDRTVRAANGVVMLVSWSLGLLGS